MKHLYFAVTNDLSYDQRMQRICGTLAANGYRVTLVGRRLKISKPLEQKGFQQVRLRCFFNKGFLFYAEYNIRLLRFLLSRKQDAICAIDLDTIIPCLLVSAAKKITRIYDAHELFTELKEVVSRPAVHRFWLAVERFAVPKFRLGYTVSGSIAAIFQKRYGVQYALIRNMPLLQSQDERSYNRQYLFYQGAVNEARGFEYLIPAMKHLPYKLLICGDGNFMPQVKALIAQHGVQGKVVLTGMVSPAVLRQYSSKALLGINLVENKGLNQYLSLANKFFDYIHAGLPQVTMAFPEYKTLNDQYKVAILLDELSAAGIAGAIQLLVNDTKLYNELQANCLKAKTTLNWQEEERQLLLFYKNAIG